MALQIKITQGAFKNNLSQDFNCRDSTGLKKTQASLFLKTSSGDSHVQVGLKSTQNCKSSYGL